MGMDIVQFLYDLHLADEKQDPNAPKQVFRDREEVRHAMNRQRPTPISEDDFVAGLVWAEKKGWITAQPNEYLQ